jgi:hypothetical protein
MSDDIELDWNAAELLKLIGGRSRRTADGESGEDRCNPLGSTSFSFEADGSPSINEIGFDINQTRFSRFD